MSFAFYNSWYMNIAVHMKTAHVQPSERETWHVFIIWASKCFSLSQNRWRDSSTLHPEIISPSSNTNSSSSVCQLKNSFTKLSFKSQKTPASQRDSHWASEPVWTIQLSNWPHKQEMTRMCPVRPHSLLGNESHSVPLSLLQSKNSTKALKTHKQRERERERTREKPKSKHPSQAFIRLSAAFG